MLSAGGVGASYVFGSSHPFSHAGKGRRWVTASSCLPLPLGCSFPGGPIRIHGGKSMQPGGSLLGATRRIENASHQLHRLQPGPARFLLPGEPG